MKTFHRKLRIDWRFDKDGIAWYHIYELDRRKAKDLAACKKWNSVGSGACGEEALIAHLADAVKKHIAYDVHCRQIAREKRAQKKQTRLKDS